MIHIRLREIRKRQGLTQQGVADYLGLDRTTYTYYETGTICPSLATFQKLSEMYRVSVSYLICETDTPELKVKDSLPEVAESYDFKNTISKEEKELIIFFRALDEKKKKQLLKRLNPNKKRYEPKE